MNRFIAFACIVFFGGLSEGLLGQVRILPETMQESAAFGFHLAQDGAWLLVGAKDDTIGNITGGAAYFFKLINGNWQFWQKVGAEQPTESDLFGISVDIDGEYAVIGADGDDEVSVNSGAAYIFKLTDGYWQLTQKLLPEETGLGSSEMGIAVSMKDEVLIVGAYSDMTNGPFAGAAYVYKLVGDNWLLENKVLPGDGSADDKFGRSVNTDGQRVIVCGVLNDDDGTNSGSAYIFSKEGASWLETAKLLAPDADVNDRFGRSLAINGSYVAVGSVLDDDNGEQSGSVYIFREYTDGWHFSAKITPNDGQADDFFGYALSFHNPYLLVGAHNDDDFGLNSGAAYLFKRSGADWFQLQKMYAINPGAEANFGESVDLNDNYLAIGAPYELKENITTGAGYILESPVITNLEVTEEPWAHLYPNPVNYRVKIEVMLPEKIRFVALLDQFGRLIKTYEYQSDIAFIDMEMYLTGVYLLRIELGSGASLYRKLLKK